MTPTDERPDSGERDVDCRRVSNLLTALWDEMGGINEASQEACRLYDEINRELGTLTDRPSSTKVGVGRLRLCPDCSGLRAGRCETCNESGLVTVRPDPSTSGKGHEAWECLHQCPEHAGEDHPVHGMIDAAPTENALENQMEKRSNEHIADVLVALAGNQEKRMDGRYLCEAARRIRSGRGEAAGTCGICGGRLAVIRGRFPGDDKREVCPTCLKERAERVVDTLTPAKAEDAALDEEGGDG